jgi:hypothetical protein
MTNIESLIRRRRNCYSTCIAAVLFGFGLVLESSFAQVPAESPVSSVQKGVPICLSPDEPGCDACEDTIQLFTRDLGVLTEALSDPNQLQKNFASGSPILNKVSPAFMMALNGDKITAKACRETCMAAGGEPNLCRVACSQLKNATCCGVWALIQHMLRHGQKKSAEALLLVYNTLCKGMK